MKVASLRCYAIPTPVKSFVFAALETDEGIVGFGEGTLDDRWRSVMTGIGEGFGRLAGQDPFAVERHWNTLETQVYWGGGVAGRSALSTLDQALWDIVGKATGQPLHRLWGGPLHDRIDVYLNQWWRGTKSTAELIDRAQAAVAKGARALKWYPVGYQPDFRRTYRGSEHPIEKGIAEVHALREAVGPGIGLMVDIWRGLDWASAARFCAGVEDCNLLFVEEPLEYVGPEPFARLADATRTRIAAGERLCSRREFAPYLSANAFGLAQPSLIRVGGLTEARKIAVMADCAGIPVSPHNPYGPVAAGAAIQLAASLPNFFMLETYENDFPPVAREITLERFDIEGGHFPLSDRPGLGVDLDEKRLRALASEYYEMHWDRA